MNLKNTSVYLLAAWMLAACAGSGLQKTENGVIIEVSRQRPADVRKVRLEVMGEKLIRVSATPEKEFSKEPSLILIPRQHKKPPALRNAEQEAFPFDSPIAQKEPSHSPEWERSL